jgi:hypothetical protein
MNVSVISDNQVIFPTHFITLFMFYVGLHTKFRTPRYKANSNNNATPFRMNIPEVPQYSSLNLVSCMFVITKDLILSKLY